MKTLLLLLDWQLMISLGGIIAVCIAWFVAYVVLVIAPKQEEKQLEHDAMNSDRWSSMEIDFPKPLIIKGFRPNTKDADRLILEISRESKWDGMSLKLQKYLELKLNSHLDISIKVYDRPRGEIWVNLRKLKKEKKEWEDIVIATEEHLKVFFGRRIVFCPKK